MLRRATVGFVLVLGALAVVWALWPDALDHGRAPRVKSVASGRATQVGESSTLPDDLEFDDADYGEDEPREMTTRFIVTDGTGPAANVLVRFAEGRVEGETGTDGVVTLTHNQHQSRYVVRKIGFRAAFGDVYSDDDVAVTIHPARAARGRVVFAENGAPAAGARVHVRAATFRHPYLDAVLRADASGRYTIAGLDDDWPVNITVVLPGYVPVTCKARARPIPLITIGGGGRIQGRVTDSNGNSLAGAGVVVCGRTDDEPTREEWDSFVESSDPRNSLFVAHVRTGADGRYSMQGLAVPAEYTIAAFGRRRGTARVPRVRLLSAKAGLRVDLKIEDGASLRISVVDESGAEVPNCSVDIEPVDAQIVGFVPTQDRTPDGVAAIAPDLVPGGYRISVTSEFFLPNALDVRLRPGERREVRIALTKGAAIQGVVVDAAGRGVSGMQVRFGLRGEGERVRRSFKSTVSGEDGSFLLEGLRGGRGVLTVTRPTRRGKRPPVAPLTEYAPVRLTDVRSDAHELRIVLPLAARVVGVFDPNPARIELEAFVGDSFWPGLVRTGSRFEITALPLGETVVLMFTASGLAPLDQKLAPLVAGEVRDLGTVRFAARAVVSGVVRNEAGEAIAGASVLIIHGAEPNRPRVDEQGRFRFSTVPAEAVRMIVEAKGYAARIVRVPAGVATESLVVTLSEGGVISGRIVDRDGKLADPINLSLSVEHADDKELQIWDPPEINAASEYSSRLARGRYVLVVKFFDDGDWKESSRHTFEIQTGKTTKLNVALK